MPAFRLRHFFDPQTLQGITPSRPIRFLSPYREFFSSRQFKLPAADRPEADALDYGTLAAIFMTPDAATPDELVHALFLVEEMSFPEATENLLDAARTNGIQIEDGDDHTPADIAIQVWLGDRTVLEQKHASQFLFRAKSFEFYRADQDKSPAIATPSPFVRTSLEHDLDEWFSEHKRGRDSRVFVYPDEKKVWFLVRHGEPLRREESIFARKATSICYRPLKYDVVIYDRRRGELRINARLTGEKKLYVEQFARHLFPENTSFSKKKYTLRPLIEMGVESLGIGTIAGIEEIKLTELHLAWGGAYSEIEIRKADDLFAAFAARGFQLSESSRPVKAVFDITFSDCAKPRAVTVTAGNKVQYTRDTDAPAVEEWLDLRGFVETKQVSKHGAVA